jgi:hypothetical protein
MTSKNKIIDETKLKKKITLCIYETCPKRSSFNFPTEIQALYCSEHKKDDMIDIKNKRCITD